MDLYCRNDVDPILQGTLSWDIINYYIEPGTTSAFPFDITYQKHINHGGTNSNFESIKTSAVLGTGATHSFRLIDATTVFQLDPLLNCH